MISHDIFINDGISLKEKIIHVSGLKATIDLKSKNKFHLAFTGFIKIF